MRRYRFFFHYNKKEGKMTTHFRKKCIITDDIICEPPCTTKWNKTQPYIVMQGYASDVKILNSNITHIIK